jgi:HEAT repeat protein
MNDLVERQQSDNEDTVLAALDDIVQNIRLGGRIDEHGVHVIMGYLACNNRRVRMQAKLTLAAIGQPAVPALIAALADPLRSQMAKHTFGMMPERIAIPVLIGALYHDNPAAVINQIRITLGLSPLESNTP